ncbi:MAG: phosphatase PAP2 family protein [Dokdonella sp.]
MLRVLAFALFALLPTLAIAGGPFGIDHQVTYDNSGIWKRSIQKDVMVGTIVVTLGGALWEGGDTQFGDTLWRSVDAMAISGASAQLMKWTFQRERPSQTNNPNQFFKGFSSQSFPSGEVAAMTGAVTPFILTYGSEHPAVYALALLPIYDAIARVKVHGHWQSDVLVGAAVGFGAGWYSVHRESPLILSALPGGFMVGIHKSF